MEVIDVDNGLRQGCCIAPVLFNLYMCLIGLMEFLEWVSTSSISMHDEKLFRRYTRNARERRLAKCLLADDGALHSTTRLGAEKAAIEFQQASKDHGLTVSIVKTKHMVSGRVAVDYDKVPICFQDGEVDGMDQFPYLGSIIDSSRRNDVEVEKRIAQASRAFGALGKPVFWTETSD